MVIKPSYLYNGNLHTWKAVFILKQVPGDLLCDNIWTHNTTPTFFWLTAIVRTQPMTISRVAVLNSVSLEILCMVTRMGRGPIWASAKIKWRSNELWIHPSCWNSLRSLWLCQYLLMPRARFQYPIRRLIVRSHKVSKPRDLYLELYDRSEIRQAPWQHCCRGDCQISKRYEHFHTRSRAFEA